MRKRPEGLLRSTGHSEGAFVATEGSLARHGGDPSLRSHRPDTAPEVGAGVSFGRVTFLDDSKKAFRTLIKRF